MISPQAQAIRDAIRSGLPLDQIREKVHSLKEFVNEAIEAENADLREVVGEIADGRTRLHVLEYLHEWLQGPAKLEKNEHTRAHKLAEAEQQRKIINVPPHIQGCIGSDVYASTQVFVVRHDWAAALGPAIQEAGNDFSLPFWSCIFEFMMSGRCVLIWAFQPEGKKPSAVPFVETPHGWWCGDEGDVANGTPFHEAWTQIAAICVALDAEVATREVMRAPAALNKKRERTGRPKVKDFHVIDLARRYRTAGGPATGVHRSPRLHFRRGHWRHYESHQAWIKWTLVGNPDLGFVDKQYRV